MIIVCPTCKCEIAAPDAGKFNCSKCGQSLELPELPSEREKKVMEIAQGVGEVSGELIGMVLKAKVEAAKSVLKIFKIKL